MNKIKRLLQISIVLVPILIVAALSGGYAAIQPTQTDPLQGLALADKAKLDYITQEEAKTAQILAQTHKVLVDADVAAMDAQNRRMAAENDRLRSVQNLTIGYTLLLLGLALVSFVIWLIYKAGMAGK